ncbi:hypothetical protein ACWV16_09340 [Achromobacter xylosoxidans]|jgi:hypothetical protein|uniref:hypothetical protein n=1 Tax=Achromobacter TaxID=222 RepID=UPI0006C2A0DA|nr:hypothetical protein [Achromobacter xylosoxidans]ELQ7838559.1 hypothetical protein [Pseudomonas aeruginosa]MCM2570154.1 hypothetical protein [Achromobacter xylosoxidans]PNM91692.1 hypothetical protein AL490_022925 [Achromobacter xylosoxidans]WOB73720.1 hypothetical protein PZA07_31415 [Achromobacter xylosoxidans]WPQ32751.1 hypothetical protein SLH34_19150 [Achromobacter xylosoxidans]
MASVRNSCDLLSDRHARYLLILAFVLAFLGSSIYLAAPLRPFHWGLMLMAVAFAANRTTRRILAEGPHWKLAAIAVALILMQATYASQTQRYLQFSVILTIGLAHLLLAQQLAARNVDLTPFLRVLVAWWLILAWFPVFDGWTHSGRFRPEYPLTGGSWDNVNDMGTVLIFVALLWFLTKRRLPPLLFAIAWTYCLLLNRRADVVALALFGVAYLLCFMPGGWRKRAGWAAGWAILTAALIGAMHYEGMQTRAMPQLTVTHGELALAQTPGDASTDYRRTMVMDMLQQAQNMPWWQWITGMGVGQLNVTWPVPGAIAPWASPHLFWLEMTFYLGLSWPLALLWLLWRSDWRGRTCLVVAGVAGLAPSSMVYLQPFWFLLGWLFANMPGNARPSAQSNGLACS